jgi:hypothetical protein
MGEICGTNRGKRIPRWLLVGKPEGKKPLGRPGLRWLDNIKMWGWGGLDLVGLAQDRDN